MAQPRVPFMPLALSVVAAVSGACAVATYTHSRLSPEQWATCYGTEWALRRAGTVRDATGRLIAVDTRPDLVRRADRLIDLIGREHLRLSQHDLDRATDPLNTGREDEIWQVAADADEADLLANANLCERLMIGQSESRE